MPRTSCGITSNTTKFGSPVIPWYHSWRELGSGREPPLVNTVKFWSPTSSPVSGSSGVFRYDTPPKPGGWNWKPGSSKSESHHTIVLTGAGRNPIWSSPASPRSGSMAMATTVSLKSYGPNTLLPGVFSGVTNSERLKIRIATKKKSCTAGIENAKYVWFVSAPRRVPPQAEHVAPSTSLAAKHVVRSANPGNGRPANGCSDGNRLTRNSSTVQTSGKFAKSAGSVLSQNTPRSLPGSVAPLRVWNGARRPGRSSENGPPMNTSVSSPPPNSTVAPMFTPELKMYWSVIALHAPPPDTDDDAAPISALSVSDISTRFTSIKNPSGIVDGARPRPPERAGRSLGRSPAAPATRPRTRTTPNRPANQPRDLLASNQESNLIQPPVDRSQRSRGPRQIGDPSPRNRSRKELEPDLGSEPDLARRSVIERRVVERDVAAEERLLALHQRDRSVAIEILERELILPLGQDVAHLQRSEE